MRTDTGAHRISTKNNLDFSACAYLFSVGHARTKGFIKNLEISTLKTAFRQKAKQYHPDLHSNESSEVVARRQERFIKIKQAYEHLFVKLKKKGIHVDTSNDFTHPKTPKIVAVGGAKGGIGKSIFAANLSVYLAQKGFKTVAADFDLGGANLHLYLGKPSIQKNINDYLSGKIQNLQDIMETTQYGPSLIGGNSSQLGASNISFTQKLKLLRAIRRLDADYVIIDLGGDTSYNVLDFFLAADLGIVMTTCEPAAYLEAYSFIKVALYRKLARLHGPESMMLGKVDHILKRLIYETTVSREGHMVGDIEKLISRIKKEHPKSLQIIKETLLDFEPQLIVNKVHGEQEALGPVHRIKQVSRKKLHINVGYLCSLPFQDEIEKSARTLVPWVSHQSDGVMIEKIKNITMRLMDVQAKAS